MSLNTNQKIYKGGQVSQLQNNELDCIFYY